MATPSPEGSAHPANAFNDVYHGAIDVTEGQEGEPVFVIVHEFMEPPQRFIPSVVRLHFLNLRDGKCGDSSIRQTVKMIVQRAVLAPHGLGDRESGNPAISGLREVHGWNEVLLRQLPADVIQRCASIDDAIANEGAESDWWLADLRLNGPLYTLLLGGESVRLRVHVHPDFSLERVQVLLSPDDFEPSAV
jgi:hypothetical protein